MSESLLNPLLPLHQASEAELQAYGASQIVSTFGQPQAEYAAIRKSAAIMDCPHRGILELSGKDRLAFLNNLLTNQVKTLEPGKAVYVFLLNTKGRIVGDMNVLELGDKSWLEMDARMVEPVRGMLE